MAYIETLAPRDWSFCTLFGYPYVEGVRNIQIAFPCCNRNPDEAPPSLLGRVAHFGLGCLLLVPLLNTIIFVVLRIFASPTVFFDEIVRIESNRDNSPMPAALVEFNNTREALIQEYTGKHCKEPEKSKLLTRLAGIEKEAAKLLFHRDTEFIESHLRMSYALHEELLKWDKTFTYCDEEVTPNVVIQSEEIETIPTSSFTQALGLTQFEADNFLCGYYALFFMLQAVKKESFTDRVQFNELIREWHKKIVEKKFTLLLGNRRQQSIPAGYSFSTAGISWDDMQFLIRECDSLAPLRETPGCMMLEMDVFHETLTIGGSEPILLMGKSKEEDKAPNKFPIYMILKEMDKHYYFLYAEKPWDFTVVHSLNNQNVIQRLDHHTFLSVIRALKGEKTKVNIEEMPAAPA